MSITTIDHSDLLDAPLGAGATVLIAAGVTLLAIAALSTGQEPIELSLGLATLGTMVVALLQPGRWQTEEGREAVNSLVMASLITLAGFHLLA